MLLKSSEKNNGGKKYKNGFGSIDGDFVKLCDSQFDATLERAAESVLKNGNVKIIGLTGPTCSGKTTAAKKLISILNGVGAQVHVVSIDDFYKNQPYRERLDMRYATGIDFDSPDTLDIDELEKFMSDVFAGNTAKLPKFDFRYGIRSGYTEVNAGESDVFIFEGIQVLYPKVVGLLDLYGGRIMYICAESGIETCGKKFEPDEVRLLRRIVRDRLFRATGAEFTFSLWESVRKNEDENIFPYADKADVFVDTTMAYELNVLKPYLEKAISEIETGSKYFDDGMKIIEKISDINPVDRNVIGKDSLYNEFV